MKHLNNWKKSDENSNRIIFAENARIRGNFSNFVRTRVTSAKFVNIRQIAKFAYKIDS